MGIVRTVEWKLTCGLQEADTRVRDALGSLGMPPDGPPGTIHGTAKRSLMKNRWAADVDVRLTPEDGATAAVCRVEMAGNKHYEVLADLADALGDGVLDDRGLSGAVDRLGGQGRLFGRKEVRHLVNLLRSSERVVELGQGQYGGRQGLVVLTDERLFFLEKSLLSETVEEFPLEAISSMAVGKKITGETLQVYASGNAAEIKSMGHGQGDALVRAFRELQRARAEQTAPAGAPDDPVQQLERLASLQERGILSPEEFARMKAELLSRM